MLLHAVIACTSHLLIEVMCTESSPRNALARCAVLGLIRRGGQVPILWKIDAMQVGPAYPKCSVSKYRHDPVSEGIRGLFFKLARAGGRSARLTARSTRNWFTTGSPHQTVAPSKACRLPLDIRRSHVSPRPCSDDEAEQVRAEDEEQELTDKTLEVVAAGKVRPGRSQRVGLWQDARGA